MILSYIDYSQPSLKNGINSNVKSNTNQSGSSPPTLQYEKIFSTNWNLSNIVPVNRSKDERHSTAEILHQLSMSCPTSSIEGGGVKRSQVAMEPTVNSSLGHGYVFGYDHPLVKKAKTCLTTPTTFTPETEQLDNSGAVLDKYLQKSHLMPAVSGQSAGILNTTLPSVNITGLVNLNTRFGPSTSLQQHSPSLVSTYSRASPASIETSWEQGLDQPAIQPIVTCVLAPPSSTEFCVEILNRAKAAGKRKKGKQVKICRMEGCLIAAAKRTPYCSKHSGPRKCEAPDCNKYAQGRTRFCISHGGGRRCMFPLCTKGARDKQFCAAHGGGKRCQIGECTKSAIGGSGLCTNHGGGKRCQHSGCDKSSQSNTDFCVRHGGGRKCFIEGCNKVARGRSQMCLLHTNIHS